MSEISGANLNIVQSFLDRHSKKDSNKRGFLAGTELPAADLQLNDQVDDKNVLLTHTKKYQFSNKNKFLTRSLMFISGAFDGTAESLKYQYSGFKNIFPNANDYWWDPSVSWKNKYKNNDKSQGPKFMLSTTLLVGTTDGYHLTRTIRNLTMVAAITFKIGEKQKWSHYLLDAAVDYASYLLGFCLTYELMFSGKQTP